MIIDSSLSAMVASDDTSVVVEIYSADAAPTSTGFDPATALKRYSEISGVFETPGVTLAGNSYTQLITSIGRVKRTISNESNSFSVEFSNLDNEIADFEFATGFEGLIMVVRLLSRSLSTTVAKSLVLFVGRCEKPKGGTKEALSVTANQVVNSIEAVIPRRKYTAEDSSGRPASDINFEGFRWLPQYGVTSYALRVRRGGLAGLFRMHRIVTRTLQYSSFNDLDSDAYVPFGFGRVQLAGTNVSYQDLGTGIRATTAFMEGPIEFFANIRTDDPRFTIYPESYDFLRFGYPAGQGPAGFVQQPVAMDVPPPSGPGNWPGDGYYANTVMSFCGIAGSNLDEVDPAPGIIIVAIALRVITPDSSGVWNTTVWDDDAAVLTRHVLTDTNYGKLDEDWIDDDSFTECVNFNKEIVFDTSWSDIIFTPDTVNFTAGDSEKYKHLLSTGNASALYFQYLNGDKTAEETFLRTAFVEPYDTLTPIEPPGPPEPPTVPLPGYGNSSGLTYLLRRRYTCNVVVTDDMKVTDFLHKVVFISSRLYMTQAPTGKIRLHNKKPVDWALGTAALSGTSIALDDVSEWVTDLTGLALIDPNTASSETRTITDANYSTGQNSVTLTSSLGDLTIVGFAGCDGNSTPATATITVNSLTGGGVNITLDGIPFAFTNSASETIHSVAAFITGTINAHPILRRKFIATWTPGSAVSTIKGKFGSLVFATALTETHTAPVADPTAAPTGAESAGGTLSLGNYKLAYSYLNARGQTFLSPAATIAVTGTAKKITTGVISEPAGTTVNWFLSTAPDSVKLRYVGNNDGTAYVITDAPLLNAALVPDLNRTGAEVMRVSASFSDRAETRSGLTSSNVLKATYKWLLGNRAKAVNRIDLKFRDATQDYRLVELRLKDEAHIAKIKKISNFEVNGQAIDNYNQAYRITAGLLAELRDADFFYEWTADKAALLLEEGDVVAITDSGSGVYNLPVRIEAIEIMSNGGFCSVSFTARKYISTLYDDSVAERALPVIIESGFASFT